MKGTQWIGFLLTACGAAPSAAETGGSDNAMKEKWMRLLRVLVLLLAILSMGFGIARKEPRTVLKKATNICLECIGVG